MLRKSPNVSDVRLGGLRSISFYKNPSSAQQGEFFCTQKKNPFSIFRKITPMLVDDISTKMLQSARRSAPRIRFFQACSVCIIKKIKCNGVRPCIRRTKLSNRTGCIFGEGLIENASMFARQTPTAGRSVNHEHSDSNQVRIRCVLSSGPN